MLNRVIERSKRINFKQVVNKNKINSKKLLKTIDNIVATKPISHFKINGLLHVHSTFFGEPKKKVM